MKIIEDVRAKGKQKELAVEEAGKVLRALDHRCDALLNHAA